MRKILFFLFLIPLIVNAQKSPYQYFEIRDNVSLFEAVYSAPGNSANDLSKRLFDICNGMSSVKDVKNSDGIITGLITHMYFPYKKYGLGGMNMNAALKFPMKFNFKINTKQDKYKVTITGLYFDMQDFKDAMSGTPGILAAATSSDFTLDDLLCRNRKMDYRTSGKAIRENTSLEKFLYETFKLKKNDDTW
ncbi:hypothetical protein SAMN05192529_10291 [Arachidicoccus rhizosphaerae]|uniref:DUF4468 domain-containing protein n=1 Tax=Arachidicoccus rhizosphaerae TaxID=551991 RepID=A0A1H3W554_9BACT|nr:hypothetical protein [Arachidicoccus rhizosphaerae]SDZ81472.1 hypothetical protein SAMN05192529_10291 [Arachidicoccus rhizosphaerae]